MKKLLLQLMQLCPGRVTIEIDQHILYHETAQQVIDRDVNKYGIHANEMAAKNSIIRVEALPLAGDVKHPVIIYHYDVELAIKECLNQVKLCLKK